MRVYWGLRKPVTLSGHQVGDWRKRSQKEHAAKSGTGAAESKDRTSFVSILFKVLSHEGLVAATCPPDKIRHDTRCDLKLQHVTVRRYQSRWHCRKPHDWFIYSVVAHACCMRG